MGELFVSIYNLFESRKWLLWLTLAISIVGMTIGTLSLRFDEDIYNFFPEQESDISQVFSSLKLKDKLVVMFTTDGSDEGIDAAISTAEEFSRRIINDSRFNKNAVLSIAVDDELVHSISSLIYANLPLFIDEAGYDALDSLTTNEAIESRMARNYQNLISPIGGFISEHIFVDPLGLADNSLRSLQSLSGNFNYTIIDDYIFSADEKTLFGYITPCGDRNDNELVTVIESTIEEISAENLDVEVEYFGAPAVAVYNARQIKWDSIVTLNIALLIVVIVIMLAFKNRYAILLILSPVIFGALFSLSLISLLKGSISLIAVGSGSIIFGVALSYSIHMLAHTNHTNDIRRLIREIAYPLTVGSFTTIGAFIGLLFTNSRLLQDFGLFSSLTLIGTTIFALIFLPHFITLNKSVEHKSAALKFVDYISSIRFDRNKVLIVSLLIITLICGLFSNRVGFDSNIMNLNFEPEHLSMAEKRLEQLYNYADGESNQLFIASANNSNEVAKRYENLCGILDSLQSEGEILSYSSISQFVVSSEEQGRRLDRWSDFWSEERCVQVLGKIEAEAERLGFESGVFDQFGELVRSDYNQLSYAEDSQFATLFPEWLSSSEEVTSLIAQVRVADSSKRGIYDRLSNYSGLIAVDRAFFANLMAEDVQQNFYLILFISGLLIFFALLISYGRIELALMAFLPMSVSWIVILGLMAIFGVEFNIVTIILSTFIFGIGDDFSIFIMDGLLSEYRDRSQILVQHKGAILFSAFTVLIGMGALIFAGHPAMHSLGVISLIGIVVVVVVTYTLLPMVFRLFISSQGRDGGLPYTLLGFLNSVYAFGVFVIGCIFIQLLIVISHLLPIGDKRRKYIIHSVVNFSAYGFIKIMATVKRVYINEVGEDFKKSAVVIANHQSFVDILILLGLNRKMVMVTNGWVWRSPIFGRIVRYLDFFHTQDGYENLADSLREKVADGYSVIIFPEGTRSADCKIRRFHKGAFYLAERLKLDILPILIYGNGLASSKNQPLYIKHSHLVVKVLPRITANTTLYGSTYKERAKYISSYFRGEYDKLYGEHNRATNPYFRSAIIKNYIYKGPILEWYMRVKLRLERWYDHYDRILPREGVIVDLGCGYGAMSYMLSQLSDRRYIVAVDYDEEKIAVANNSALKSDRIEFHHSDVRTFDSPRADAFIISDVLHYFDYDAQQCVISRCADRLNDGGVILVRDGDSDNAKNHERTEQTEQWSTEIVKFNKSEGELYFLSKAKLEQMADLAGLTLSVVQSETKTSNTLFMLSKSKENG